MTKSERAPDRGCAGNPMEPRRQPVAVVELMATVGLALSTVVAVTAVSIGIARAADVFGIRAAGEPAPLAFALLMALLLLSMGGLTAVMSGRSKERI